MEGIKIETAGLKHALSFWRNIANENGWGPHYDAADLTVWVDDEGKVTDSVATQTGGGCVYVVRSREELAHDDPS